MAFWSGHSAHFVEVVNRCNSDFQITFLGLSTQFVGVCVFLFDLAPNSSTNCEIQSRELKAMEEKQQHRY